MLRKWVLNGGLLITVLLGVVALPVSAAPGVSPQAELAKELEYRVHSLTIALGKEAYARVSILWP